MPSSPLIYILAGIVFLATLGGLYYKVHHDGYEEGKQEVTAKWEAANEAQRQKEAKQNADATKALEVKREKAEVVYKTITKQVEKVVEKPIYRNVCLDPDGLRLAADAIHGKSSTGQQPDKTLPGASGTH